VGGAKVRLMPATPLRISDGRLTFPDSSILRRRLGFRSPSSSSEPAEASVTSSSLELSSDGRSSSESSLSESLSGSY